MLLCWLETRATLAKLLARPKPLLPYLERRADKSRLRTTWAGSSPEVLKTLCRP